MRGRSVIVEQQESLLAPVEGPRTVALLLLCTTAALTGRRGTGSGADTGTAVVVVVVTGGLDHAQAADASASAA